MEQENKKTVLIIDDDVEFTNSLSEMLKDAGLHVHVAISGREALGFIENNSVDFIILDFIMPEMDGFEFYRRLTHDMRKNIPTIVLTNLASAKNTNDLEVFVKSETDLTDLVNKVKQRVTTSQE